MHIGIVELCEKNHHSMIFNWIKLANIKKCKVTLFTTKEIFNNVKKELSGLKYKVEIKDTNDFFFQIKINKLIKKKKINKLIYLTICNFLVYLFIPLKNINLGITIHNANTWFNKSNIVKFRHYLKRLIILKLKREASFFIVNSKNMKSFIDHNYPEVKPIYILPFSLKKNVSKFNILKNKTFTTIYPGSINHTKRKYENFIKLAILNPEDNFVLLGNTRKTDVDISIYEQMKKISNIKLYDQYIDIKNFNKVIKESHLLFSDIIVNYKSSDISEIYGKSKDSGISYLMNEFNLPCLLNSNFLNFTELRNGSLYFENFSKMYKLYSKIKKNNKHRLSLMKKIKHDTKNFTVKNYSQKLNKIFT